MSLPDIPIILITSSRTAYAQETAVSVLRHLSYAGNLIWFIAADNSNDKHINEVLSVIPQKNVMEVNRTANGYGFAANVAWKYCNASGLPVTFWLEDDWQLRRPLDITKQVELLLEVERVGCVRYSYLPTGLNLESVGHSHRMYLNVKRDRPYAFSGNPHMKHTRFSQYGWYPQGMNPGDTEIFYDGQIRGQADGPQIWWVLDIGDDPPFRHIGDTRSY